MKDNDQPKKIHLKDYQEPSYWIRKTLLSFEIYEDETFVDSELHLERNENSVSERLVLDGQDLELISVNLNGNTLSSSDYQLDDTSLSLKNLAHKNTLKIRTKIKPHLNTSLEGLYKSQKMFCTQCEAEGFRKITYYLDRPDVMSEFSVKVTAEKQKYPVLLSNGNKVGEGESESGRHWVEWHDPHLKPCYLFALVAGDLKHIDDSFRTQSGRDVLLRIFVEEKDLDKCDHAIRSLKNAMRWDEEVYGREYDLDIFMIVAVDDFNMGAMENKGLNIFNTSCVLANPATTTDAEFQRVEGVVAHEYFHNWSGNRVTCRDWFQLSLKEGFTVFRDAEFSADMGSRTVKRVEDVSLLRSFQFAEDAGPMAHPVQPDSFIDISNFYTLTIYEKGAEVVRMIHSLLGAEVFRAGTDLYFDRNDGRAATIEDFIAAMTEASGRDFSQFMNWYRQAGTPELKVSGIYNKDQETYTLTFKQRCRPTPESSEKKPYLVPVSTSLLGDAGKLPISIRGTEPSETDDNTQVVIEVTQESEEVVFENVKERPVPSLLRGFSAPVKLEFPYSNADLKTIIRSEDDGFCKWDAAQQLSIREIQSVITKLTSDPSPSISDELLSAFSDLLNDDTSDPAMIAMMLSLPSEKYLGELSNKVDVEGIHHARNCVERKLAKKLKPEFLSVYNKSLDDGPFSVNADAIARRSLKNTALHYLAIEGSQESAELIKSQFYNATNMTDELAAFRAIVHSGRKAIVQFKDECVQYFYDKWKHESLVMNHWFSVQSTQPLPQALSEVKLLMEHEAFDFKNPNKLRSVVGAFCTANVSNFHAISGDGYRFLTEQLIKLNRSNPQIASRMITPFTKWRKYDETRSAIMKQCLEDILDTENLSKDVFEVVSKSLQ